MICKHCAWEADRVKSGTYVGPIEYIAGRVTRCPACLRDVAVHTTAPELPSFMKVVRHKDRGSWCSGAGKPAVYSGHFACTGCDCQHRPIVKKES